MVKPPVPLYKVYPALQEMLDAKDARIKQLEQEMQGLLEFFGKDFTPAKVMTWVKMALEYKADLEVKNNKLQFELQAEQDKKSPEHLCVTIANLTTHLDSIRAGIDTANARIAEARPAWKRIMEFQCWSKGDSLAVKRDRMDGERGKNDWQCIINVDALLGNNEQPAPQPDVHFHYKDDHGSVYVPKEQPAPNAPSPNGRNPGVIHTPASAASSKVAMLPAGSQVEERDGKAGDDPTCTCGHPKSAHHLSTEDCAECEYCVAFQEKRY